MADDGYGEGYDDPSIARTEEERMAALRTSRASTSAGPERDRIDLELFRLQEVRRKRVTALSRARAADKRKAERLIRTSFDVPRDLVPAFRGEAAQLLARLRRRGVSA